MRCPVCLCVCLLVAAAASAEVPRDGLAAEMAGDWELAAVIYRETLEREPGRGDLWQRLAQIQARLEQHELAADSLRQAVALDPTNPDLHHRLSQTCAMLDQPQPALEAIGTAIELAPERAEYWLAQGQLANWVGDLPLARHSYQQALALAPERRELLLDLARTRSWEGRLDESARDFADYLKAHPENSVVFLESARVETWRGDYDRALDVLDTYRSRFGDDLAQSGQRARVYARANRPRQALALSEPLFSRSPEDYQVNFTRAIAYANGGYPLEAEQTLQHLERLRPGSPDTIDLARFLRTPQRSSVGLDLQHYEDADDVESDRASLFGVWRMNLETSLVVQLDRRSLDGRAGSGLESISGDRVDDDRLAVGIEHRFSPLMQTRARIGRADIEGVDELTVWDLEAALRPRDNLWLTAGLERQPLDISARSLSLGIERDTLTGRLQWHPGLENFFDLQLRLDDYSDGNDRAEAALGYRHAVLRREDINLDLGLSGWWFGYDEDLSNGYYDPDSYRRLAATFTGYWKLNDDNGIAFDLAPGFQKDESQAGYELGTDASVEGIFGIFRDWYARVRIAYTDRRQPTGAFDAASVSVHLERRL